jgi:hypothetical protein
VRPGHPNWALVQFGFFHSHRGFSPVIGKFSATQQPF